MNTKQPQQYPHRILLLVSGMSPQIVTETLFALTQAQRPAFVPTAVHLITTTTGAEQARLNLLEGPRHFQHFCDDYGLDAGIFTQRNIHVITGADGQPMMDIRTPVENEATADFITEKLLAFTDGKESGKTALHVSIAGGRKTMGYYAGYALSLFGRAQDRLSHVLVSQGYEGLPDFYYPTPESRTIYNRAREALDSAKAEVSLAEIPFVRLRDGLPPSLLDGGHGFNETVALARLGDQPVTLVLNPARRTYRIDALTERLTPVQMLLLLWAAHRRLHGLPAIEPVLDEELDDPNRADYARELLELADEYWLNLNAKTVDKLGAEGATKAFLETTISRLNRTLREQLGPNLAERCKLASHSHNGHGGYDLPHDLKITIEQDSP